MKMGQIHWSVHNALTQWQWTPFPLFILLLLVAVAYWYLRAEWQLAAKGRTWPRNRTIMFMIGLFAIDVALQSPMATFTQTYFEAHVMQHLLLMIVAPPALALGAPSTLLLQTSHRPKLLWLKILRSRPFAVLTHPVVVWFLYFGLMFAFFLSSLINTAMQHMWLMDIMNLLFFFSATLYWWPMVGLDPIVHWKMGYGARMLNIALGAPPEVILGLAIMTSRKPVASMYSLSSTHAGGGLLWVFTEAATFIGIIPIFFAWVRSEEREARRADARADRLAEEALRVANQPVTVPVPVAASLVAEAGAASFGGVDWRGKQYSAWEGMFLAKAHRVPVTRAYMKESLTERRAGTSGRDGSAGGSEGDLDR